MLEGQDISPSIDRHRFRGEFLDCFAQIEHHVHPALERLVKIGVAKKVPYLFGQKFELLRKNVDQTGLWKHRVHVAGILDDLAEFADLRGDIGHGVMGEATVDDETAFFWHPPGMSDWTSRRVMTVPEAEACLSNLRRLTGKFKKQLLTGD